MIEAYLKYYDKYSAIAPLRFSIDSLFSRKKLARLSLIHRQRDYLHLAKNPGLFTLHRQINECLLQGAKHWNSYDYGEGYFYQSFQRIGVTGFRDTEGRVKAMRLQEWVSGKRVLEVGCNTGFLSLSVAPHAVSVTAFDIAPHLTAISGLVARHLGIENATFQCVAFEDFQTSEQFEVVLSFANHSTYDGNTKQPLASYFDRCAKLVQPGGVFLFESHPPQHEGEGLEVACQLISERFSIRSREVLNYGTFLDRKRTFVVAEH